MANQEKVLQNVMAYLEKKNIHFDFYPGIAEMGYTDKPMICANWNPDNMNKLYKWAENYFDNLELDWSDEWTNCSECYKAIRTSPDSYGWLPSYLWTSDCSIACVECYEKCKEDIIEFYKNLTNKAITPEFYPFLESAGFICYSPDEYCKIFETGWHPGQNDDPRKVAKDIEKELPDYDYIFKIDSSGQFDISWSVYLRRREE